MRETRTYTKFIYNNEAMLYWQFMTPLKSTNTAVYKSVRLIINATIHVEMIAKTRNLVEMGWI